MDRPTKTEFIVPGDEVLASGRVDAKQANSSPHKNKLDPPIIIERFGSIADVDAPEWDRMAGDSVLASHGWLSTIEETRTTNHAVRYFVARKNLELAGAITCYLEQSSDTRGAVPLGGHTLDKMMLGRLAKLGRYSGVLAPPYLICGAPMGRQDPLTIPPGTSAAESAQIAEALVDVIERTARNEGWTVCFRQVKREGSPLGAVLTKRGYLRGSEQPSACLELERDWTTFADYRRHLKKDHPNTAKTIGNELNRAKKMRLAIERIDDPGALGELMHRLINTHDMNHNGTPWPYTPDFFERAKARLGDGAVFYGARLEGRLVGVSFILQGGTDVIGSMIGIDAEANRNAAVYFNLAYNDLIERSIDAGMRRIWYGQLLWDVKMRRGCDCVEADFYLRPRNALQRTILRRVVRTRSQRHDAMSAPLRRRGAEAEAKD